MDETIQNVILPIAVALIILVLYMLRRRPTSGMKLKLKTGKKGQSWDDGLTPTATPQGKSQRMVEVETSGEKRANKNREEKTLNVIFNYNGHSFDAYEVLDIPAGSSQEAVEKAYKDALGKVDEASKEFIETAYKAIRSK